MAPLFTGTATASTARRKGFGDAVSRILENSACPENESTGTLLSVQSRRLMFFSPSYTYSCVMPPFSQASIAKE
jgi:hypothetical protein